MRNAESLFNEARLISYAIYNIAAVNIAMIAIQYVIIICYVYDITYKHEFLENIYHVE